MSAIVNLWSFFRGKPTAPPVCVCTTEGKGILIKWRNSSLGPFLSCSERCVWRASHARRIHPSYTSYSVRIQSIGVAIALLKAHSRRYGELQPSSRASLHDHCNRAAINDNATKNQIEAGKSPFVHAYSSGWNIDQSWLAPPSSRAVTHSTSRHMQHAAASTQIGVSSQPPPPFWSNCLHLLAIRDHHNYSMFSWTKVFWQDIIEYGSGRGQSPSIDELSLHLLDSCYSILWYDVRV